MGSIYDDVRAAEAMGLSYGRYKALIWEQQHRPASDVIPSTPPKKPQRKQKRYKDADAFKLWQEGKTDAQIGEELGVSRQLIQRWRDTMELPSTAKTSVDTSKYRLMETDAGLFIFTENSQ